MLVVFFSDLRGWEVASRHPRCHYNHLIIRLDKLHLHQQPRCSSPKMRSAMQKNTRCSGSTFWDRRLAICPAGTCLLSKTLIPRLAADDGAVEPRLLLWWACWLLATSFHHSGLPLLRQSLCLQPRSAQNSSCFHLPIGLRFLDCCLYLHLSSWSCQPATVHSHCTSLLSRSILTIWSPGQSSQECSRTNHPGLQYHPVFILLTRYFCLYFLNKSIFSDEINRNLI